MDFSKFSDDDLRALKSGDYTKLSDDGLRALHEQSKPVSQMESLGRGALQGASLGYSDEAVGGGEAMLDKLMGSHEKLLDLYRQHRDESRANNEKAQRDNPKTYLAGNVAGGIGSALATGGAGAGIMGGAAIGAAAGLGNSNADLTKGEVGQAAIDTGVGGVIGGALGGASKGLSALRNTGAQTAERLAIKSLNGSPEETGAMLKAVGNDNRENVGRTLLKKKILGKYGLASDNEVAENLQRASDSLGAEQNAMIKKLGDRSTDLETIKQNVLNKMDQPYSIEAQNANGYVGRQLDTLPKREVGLEELNRIKKQWQGLSDYPSAGSPTPQDVTNAAAMRKATGGVRQTLGEVAPELNPQLRSESNIFQAREAMRSRPELISSHGASLTGAAVRGVRSYGNQIGAITADKVSQILQSSPQSLGKYADILRGAAQRSPESLKATLHVLQMSDPEFRQQFGNNQE